MFTPNSGKINITIISLLFLLLFAIGSLFILLLKDNMLLSKDNTLLSKHNNSNYNCFNTVYNTWEVSYNKITIAAVGDINYARGVANHIDTTSFDRPISEVAEILKIADITTGNLESPISDIGSPMDKKYVFRAKPQSITALENAGFDILNIANNHAFDYGLSAFVDCLERFEKTNMQIVGGGRNLKDSLVPKYMKVNGIRVAFLAFNDTRTNFIGKDKPACAPAHEPYIFDAIASAKELCDILIVHLHWGEEYSLLPNERQISLGHAMIDSGATVIIGHHPHSWQAVEFYKNGLIAYSLGNFVFDQKDLMNNLSAILLLEFQSSALKEVRLIPIELITAPKEARPANSLLSDLFLAYLHEGLFFTNTEIIKKEDGSIILQPILR